VGAKTGEWPRRARRCVVKAALAVCWLAGEARGQAPPEPVPAPAPVQLSAAYKAEGWAVSGGREGGTTYLDNLDLGLAAEQWPPAARRAETPTPVPPGS